MISRTLVPRLACLCAASLLLAGCNGGLIAIGSSGSSGSSNAKPVVSSFQAPRSATSPASLFFVVFDEEGDATEVQIRYRVGGAAFKGITLGAGSPPLAGIPSSSGTPYEVRWDFAADLGGEGYQGGIDLQLVAVDGISPPNLKDVDMGNDVPTILAAGPLPAGAPEYGANVDLGFTAADSAGDVLKIKVEYNDDAAGGWPASGWKLARPAATPLSQPTPEYAITGFLPDPAGTDGTLRWDTQFDLPAFDENVLVRFTPEDAFAVGSSMSTAAFRIDNNEVPTAQLLEGPLVASPDKRRGIAIPFTLFDEESDDVQVVIQWRRVGEVFADLPDDPATIAQILADPLQRKALGIVTETPFSVGGRVDPIDATSVRLPELGASASLILKLRNGIVGDQLAILRESSIPEPLGLPAGLLSGPVASLPRGDGRTALVLDRTQAGAGWQVREIQLGTGQVLQTLASAAGALPSTMALELGGAALLVAEELAGGWQLQRVDLTSGATQLLVGAGGLEAPVHGLQSLGTHVALLTAGNSLVRVGYDDLGQAQTAVLLDDLALPRGLVADPLDPLRVYVAEQIAPGADPAGRVRALELDSHARSVLHVQELGTPGDGLPRPTALALERGGARLLVLTDADPFDGLRELRGVDIGGVELGEVFEITGDLPQGAAGLATGPDGLRLVALAASNDLAVGGGLEQMRSVAGYDPSEQTVSVASPFAPDLQVARAWRWSKPAPSLFATGPLGETDFLLWDSVDSPGADLVHLRLTAYDSDKGGAHSTSVVLPVLAPLDVAAIQVGAITGSFEVISADLDGNGLLDLVSTSNIDSSMVVFLQSSPGQFPPDPSFTLGSFATTAGIRSVVAADLNDDGLIDLASANTMKSELTVFLQSGTGGFPSTPDYTIPVLTNVTPVSVDAGDLNGDGLLDLISANVNGSNLTIFFQKSTGGFPSSPDVTLGNGFQTFGARRVRIADLNGDDLLDVVSANVNGENLTLFEQQTPGQFSTSPITLEDPVTMNNPVSVEAADLNGDGLMDVVSANEHSANLTVFFQPSSGWSPTTPDLVLGGFSETLRASSVEASDLNGDGLLDLVAASFGSNSLGVFLQSSPGQFATSPSLVLTDDALIAPEDVEVADLNGDGLLDLASASTSKGLTVFLHASLGLFPTSPDLAVPASAVHITAGDLNGDGLLDLVSAGGLESLSVFFQTGLGQFSPAPDLSLSAPGSYHSAIADLNDDGWLDIVSANLSSRNLTVFLQTGSGQFSTSPDYTLADSNPQSLPYSVAAADLNDDGLIDVVSANGLGDNLTVYLQSGPGVFPTLPSLTLADPGTMIWPQSVVAVDLNDDGRIDIASANRNSNNLSLFFQNGSGSFPSDPQFTLGGPGTTDIPQHIAAGDLNGDGLLDLVSSNVMSDTLTGFFQTSPGQFSTSPSFTLSEPVTISSPFATAIADLNHDGQLDLVSANSTSDNLTVFFQSSPGRFPTSPSLVLEDFAVGSPFFVTTADLNRDGQLDLLSANTNLLQIRFQE